MPASTKLTPAEADEAGAAGGGGRGCCSTATGSGSGAGAGSGSGAEVGWGSVCPVAGLYASNVDPNTPTIYLMLPPSPKKSG